MSKHPAFRSWADMLSRCKDPNHKWFPSYGGRGVTVATSWEKSFQEFWNDLGSSYFSGAQLGRIDNDGNYTVENCRWETAKQQQRNKSNTRRVLTPEGLMQITDAAERYGLSSGCLAYRQSRGYSPEDMVKPSERSK